MRGLLWLLAAVSLALLTFAVPTPAEAAVYPNKDNFGYRAMDNVNDGLVFSWNSIQSAPGYTAVTLSDDSCTGATPIGFTFPFYGTSQTQLYIASNGGVTFSSTSCATTAIGTIPSMGNPNGIVAGYWTDLNPADAGCVGSVGYLAEATTFTLQFTDVTRYGTGCSTKQTFQVKLHASGMMEVLVKQGQYTGSTTIGIERPDGSDGLQYQYASGVMTDRVVRFFKNMPPTPVLDKVTAVEDGPTVEADVLENDSDPEGDPLDIVSVTGAKKGVVAIKGKAPDEYLEYTPLPDENTGVGGPEKLTYTVEDGQGNSVTATLEVTITPANDAPSFKVTPFVYGEEDVPGEVKGWAYDLVLGPTPDEGLTQKMVFEVTSEPKAFASATVTSDGTLKYTLLPDVNGFVKVTVKGSDDGGTAHNGVDQGPTREATLQVLARNDEPVFTAGPGIYILEGEADQGYSVPWASEMAAGPPTAGDEAGQRFTFDVVNTPLSLFAEDPVIDPDGVLSFRTRPDACTKAPVSMHVYVRDDGGTARAGDDTNGPNPVELVIECVNDAPQAQVDTFIVDRDAGPQVLDALANDLDVDGDVLTVSAVTNVGGSPSTAKATDDKRALHYTPAKGFSGIDFLRYTVKDAAGLTATADVFVSVVCPGFRAADDRFTGTEDQVLSTGPDGQPANVRANDPVRYDTVATLLQGSPQGTVQLAPDGTFTFTPKQDFAGRTSFLYQLTSTNPGDPADTCRSLGRVELELAQVPDPPKAVEDPAPGMEASFTTKEDMPIAALPVLANDKSDAGGLRILSATQPDGGSVVLAGGKLRFQPKADYAGETSFMYTVIDDSGETSSAVARVRVTSEADAPKPQPDRYTARLGGTIHVRAPEGVLANDHHPEGLANPKLMPLRAQLVEAPIGAFALHADGSFTYTPPHHSGVYRFVYRPVDASGVAGNTVEVLIEVGSSSPPQAAFEAPAGSVLTGSLVLFHDLSRDADGPLRGRAWDFGDGGRSTDANPSHAYKAPGVYRVTLTVTDSDGYTASASHDVHVVDLLVLPEAPHGVWLEAGPDQTVAPGSLVQLAGAASDGVTWSWTQADGPVVVLSGADGPRPSFKAPDVPTVLILRAVVRNGDVVSQPDDVRIVVELPGQPAIQVDAGEDRTVRPGERIHLKAEASGLDHAPVWRHVSGPLVVPYVSGDGVDILVPDLPGRVVRLSAGSLDGAIVDEVELRIVPDVGVAAQLASHDPLSVAFRSIVPGTQTWDFGDGTTATGSDPVHRYAAAGTYTVTLTVETAAGDLVYQHEVRVQDNEVPPVGAELRPGSRHGEALAVGGATVFGLAALAAAGMLLWRRARP